MVLQSWAPILFRAHSLAYTLLKIGHLRLGVEKVKRHSSTKLHPLDHQRLGTIATSEFLEDHDFFSEKS